MLNHLPPANATINPPRDPNTLSNYNNFRTTHTKVDFHIDFAQKSIHGNVVLTLKSLTNAEAKEIILDTSHLLVHNVTIGGKSMQTDLAARFEPYGSPLKITLDKGVEQDESIDVVISLATTENSTALQWMTPEQAKSKHPYMFSQCQAIHARSIFPCQDTPDVKSTFEFRLRSSLPAIASGIPHGHEPVPDSTDLTYIFKQDVPIPSYLFAIASGDIASAPIGPRSDVWTSPDALKAAQWEFEHDTENYIKAAEKIVFPYAWGPYNLLILPASFPYGGMENCNFTFATPTVVSGDRENVDLVAHELAHSWSGNLVTNASWEHFWLNEGWTTYLERRLQAALHGEPFRDFSAIIGWKGLEDSVKLFGPDHDFTKLIPDLKGKDPDNAFSQVPYEKGHTFLYTLEKLLGQDKWNTFIPHYFQTFKFKSIDSYDFKANLLSFFASDAHASELLSKIDWDTWFYGTGLPPKPAFDTTMVDKCYVLRDQWAALQNGHTSFKPSPDDIKGWRANQIVVFLEAIQSLPSPLDASRSRLMSHTYSLLTSRNVELLSRYLVIGLLAKDDEVKAPTVELLGSVGRMKFVRPLYRNLKIVDEALAKKTFEANKTFYHPICANMVERDLYGKK